MKLLFVIKGMKAAGGAERVISQVSAAMADRGHDTTLLTFSGDRNSYFYPVSPKVNVLNLDSGSIDQPTGAVALAGRILSLRKVMREMSPDIAIGFMHSGYVPLAFAAAGTGIPVVGSEHIVRTYYDNRRLELLALQGSVPFMKALTVLSDDIAAGFPPAVRRKMHALPNPLEPVPRRPGLNDGVKQKLILSVGRLDPQKDHQTLIDAFARIAADVPEWHVRIVGEGHLREALEKRIRHHGLESRIALPGNQPDIAKDYSEAALFVLPSKFESFGLVVAEAMLEALPVVAFSACPGIGIFFPSPDCGTLVSGPDRVAALAAAMRDLIGNAAKRTKMGRCAKAAIQNRFPPHEIYDRWEKLLKSTANNHKRRVEGEA